uniref:DeoR/GlpR family DNA-binding transcription regulator n=1 Tax=uncultured Altererythrobacter sp. TaxID=500840 RepID=UPI00262FBA9F|nr:DeoR/GlpR family DNA-binding transcription regulator [uncultured Altererythrobacter sp.]
MHAAEREEIILEALKKKGFTTYRHLEANVEASPATIRRDLARLEKQGKIVRLHGGAKAIDADSAGAGAPPSLAGTPFEKSLKQNIAAKRAIGKAAAKHCAPGEGIIIDGGTTTYQMCEHLDDLNLQVLTNSLHIVNALLRQEATQLLVPSGPIFREQNIILAPAGETTMPNFHASKLFLGAAAVSARGIFQADALLVASQRRFLDRTDEVILVVDSSKLQASSGAIVCELDRIDRMITDDRADPQIIKQLREAGLQQIDLVKPAS